MAANALPLELVELIISSVSEGLYPTASERQTLAHLSLTSRRWQEPSQRALFQHIKIIASHPEHAHLGLYNACLALRQWQHSAARARFPLRSLVLDDDVAERTPGALGSCDSCILLERCGPNPEPEERILMILLGFDGAGVIDFPKDYIITRVIGPLPDHLKPFCVLTNEATLPTSFTFQNVYANALIRRYRILNEPAAYLRTTHIILDGVDAQQVPHFNLSSFTSLDTLVIRPLFQPGEDQGKAFTRILDAVSNNLPFKPILSRFGVKLGRVSAITAWTRKPRDRSRPLASYLKHLKTFLKGRKLKLVKVVELDNELARVVRASGEEEIASWFVTRGIDIRVQEEVLDQMDIDN